MSSNKRKQPLYLWLFHVLFGRTSEVIRVVQYRLGGTVSHDCTCFSLKGCTRKVQKNIHTYIAQCLLRSRFVCIINILQLILGLLHRNRLPLKSQDNLQTHILYRRYCAHDKWTWSTVTTLSIRTLFATLGTDFSWAHTSPVLAPAHTSLQGNIVQQSVSLRGCSSQLIFAFVAATGLASWYGWSSL